MHPPKAAPRAAAGAGCSREFCKQEGSLCCWHARFGSSSDLVQLIFASFLGTGSSPQLARALAYPAGAPQRKNCIQELGNFGIFGCQSVLGSRIWIPSCLRSGHVAPGAFFLLAGAGQSRACRGSGRFSRHACERRGYQVGQEPWRAAGGWYLRCFLRLRAQGWRFGSALSGGKEWSHALDFLSCCRRSAGR